MYGNRYLVWITTGMRSRRKFVITDKEEEEEEEERHSALQEWLNLTNRLEETSAKFGRNGWTIITDRQSGDYYLESLPDTTIKLKSSDLIYLLESFAEYKELRHGLSTLWSKYKDRGYKFKKLQQGEWGLVEIDNTDEVSKA